MKALINVYYGKIKQTVEYKGTTEEIMQYLKELHYQNTRSWIAYTIEESDKN